MNNSFLQSTKHILSRYINENTRVLDLMGGENVYSAWLSSQGTGEVIPLSPDVLEHIKSENPFVAYNNFINDSRLLPTQGGKADLVILMGPLYSMQSAESRTRTLGEVKRLLSKNGRVITLCSKNYLEPIDLKNAPACEKDAVKLSQKNELENAGFEINSITQLPKDSHGKSSYIAVASVMTVPSPAVSHDAIPPEVRIPHGNIVIEREENGLVTYYREPYAPNETAQEAAYRKVHRSIQPFLQHHIVRNVFPSIDSSVQPQSFITEKPFIRTKPTELVSENNGRQVFRSIEKRLQEKLRPAVMHSIDAELQGSYTTDKQPFISMADIDISKLEYKLREIRKRLPIFPREILDNYEEPKPEEPPKAEQPQPIIEEKQEEPPKEATPERQKPPVRKSIDSNLQGSYGEKAEETPPTVKRVERPAKVTEEKPPEKKRTPPPHSENFGLNIMPSIDSRLIFRKTRSKLTSAVHKSIDSRLVMRKNHKELAESRKVKPSIDNRLNKKKTETDTVL